MQIIIKICINKPNSEIFINLIGNNNFVYSDYAFYKQRNDLKFLEKTLKNSQVR